MSPVVLHLHPRADRRVRAGHPWLFSNEIATDLRPFEPGCTVDVVDAHGRYVGRGYTNPRSLIAVRLLSRDRRDDVDLPGFYARRLAEALAYREAACPGRQALRLVHGEADGLPGLVVDRYGDLLAIQINTAGMERRREALREAIEEVLSPAGVVLRNDGRSRKLEGLPLVREAWFGEVPDRVEFEEHGVRFAVDPMGGQKTGHFFDQADNRRRAAALCPGQSVLDVYAYSGAWALHALVAGAERAVAVDSSEPACVAMKDNAELNGVSDRLAVVHDEGKRSLELLVGEGARFGVVILDPPAFAKTRKAASSALRGYRDVNSLALALVEPGGFLFTSTCSYHVKEDRFLEALRQAAVGAGRRVRIAYRGSQAADHPVLPGVPETRYLKCFGLHVGV